VNNQSALTIFDCEDLGFDAQGLRTEMLLEAQRRSLEMVVQGAALTDVLSHLALIVESQCRDSVACSILLMDGAGCLRHGAAPSLPPEYCAAVDGIKISADVGTCGAAAATGSMVITEDIDADPKWQAIKHLPLAMGLKAVWAQPIVARDGRVLGTFGTYYRVCRCPSLAERQLTQILSHTAALAIERMQMDAAREQERRLIDIALDAAEMGTWRYCYADNICDYNRQAQRLYGLMDGRFLHDEAGVQRLIHPDDIPTMWRAVKAAEESGRYTTEYRVRRPEGGWRWLSAWGLVDYEGEGAERHPVAIIGASRDITERKDAEAQQKLLVDELSHRVRNTLSIIQSIAAQTLRDTPEPAAFKTAFTARLTALSRAHSLLTKALWQGTRLSDIVATTLDPFGGERRAEAIRFDGPPIIVKPNAAVMLCLVLHELATNAAKYGALSAPDGRIDFVWSKSGADPDAESTLELLWSERGGPQVVPPSRQGFGSRLIAAGAAQLGGTAALDYANDGVRCRFSFPLHQDAFA
jgi:PAS domain S-box-containing protein